MRDRVKRILVAQIGAPHGVRGEVRLKAFTENPLSLADYGPLETEDGSRQFAILSMRPAKDMLVVRIDGVSDREGAESLKHMRLYVPRERLPAIAEEETYYHADLIGLSVLGDDGLALGSVVAVHNHGGGDMIEIAPAEGGPTLLLPFTKTAVPVIDIANGKLVVDPPDEVSGGKIPPLKGEGRPRSSRGGVMDGAAEATPSRSRSARPTSPLQGED